VASTETAGLVAGEQFLDAGAQGRIAGTCLVQKRRPLAGVGLLEGGQEYGFGGSGINRHGRISSGQATHQCDGIALIVSPRVEKDTV
jgi:hypothetical protein